MQNLYNKIEEVLSKTTPDLSNSFVCEETYNLSVLYEQVYDYLEDLNKIYGTSFKKLVNIKVKKIKDYHLTRGIDIKIDLCLNGCLISREVGFFYLRDSYYGLLFTTEGFAPKGVEDFDEMIEVIEKKICEVIEDMYEEYKEKSKKRANKSYIL